MCTQQDRSGALKSGIQMGGVPVAVLADDCLPGQHQQVVWKDSSPKSVEAVLECVHTQEVDKRWTCWVP